MLPKWSEEYSVHNAKIDEQHQKLFELAGEVEYMFDKPIYKNSIKHLLGEFFNYMKDHFYDEEKYMQLIGYPDFEEHKKIHKEIIQSMINLIENVKTTNDLKEKLYTISKKWLLEHILYEDMRVEEYRRSLLRTEDDEELTFEQEGEKDDETAIYLYSCECFGQIHDIPYSMHKKIQEQGFKLKCKKCKTPIVFYKKQKNLS